MLKTYFKSEDKNFYLLHGDTMEILPQFEHKFDMVFADPPYFLSNNGNIFNMIPARAFFRKYYNDIDLTFDYHVKFHYNEDELQENDFKININLELDNKSLIDMIIYVKFTGGEVSPKLSAKYKFQLADDFNWRIAQKRLDEFK